MRQWSSDHARVTEHGAIADGRHGQGDHLGTAGKPPAPAGPDLLGTLLEADAGSRATLVLQWQRDYGNAFVQRAVGDPATATAPLSHAPAAHGGRKTVYHQPHLTWRSSVKPGKEAPGVRREPSRLFRGDRLRISVDYPPRTPDQKEFAKFLVLEAPVGWVVDEIGWEGNTYILEVTALELGHYKVPIEASGFIGLEGLEAWKDTYHMFEFSVVADLEDFIMSCEAAQGELLTKFFNAHERVNQTAEAYREAFTDQKEALDRVARKEKMRDEMLWAAFMVVMALPGGALGEMVKEMHALENFAEYAKRGVSHLTDELYKFQFDSLKIMGATEHELKGPREPTGRDPLEFLMKFSAQLAGEMSVNEQRFKQLILTARQARATGRTKVFEKDPVKMVEQDTQLATIKGMPSEKKDYLRQLWAQWLQTYAWQLEETFSSHEAKYKITRDIREELDMAAKQCGENALGWLAKWAPAAKARAEKEEKEAKEKESDKSPVGLNWF